MFVLTENDDVCSGSSFWTSQLFLKTTLFVRKTARNICIDNKKKKVCNRCHHSHYIGIQICNRCHKRFFFQTFSYLKQYKSVVFLGVSRHSVFMTHGEGEGPADLPLTSLCTVKWALLSVLCGFVATTMVCIVFHYSFLSQSPDLKQIRNFAPQILQFNGSVCTKYPILLFSLEKPQKTVFFSGPFP